MNIEKKHKLVLLDAKLRVIQKFEQRAAVAESRGAPFVKEITQVEILSAAPDFGGDAA